MLKYILILLILVPLTGCPDNCDSVTNPDNGGGGGQPPPEEEPPFNPGPQFDWQYTDWVSAFALNSRDEATQRMYLRSARNRGYLGVRMCVELKRWNKYPAFRHRGPYLYGQEALDALDNTLRVIADEGMYTLVMTICSQYRHEGTDQDRIEWVRAVARRTRDFNNVGLDINEPWHSGDVYPHGFPTILVRQLISVARNASGGKFSIADQNIGARSENTDRYRYDDRYGADVATFHPWRSDKEGNPDPPNSKDVRDIVSVNGGRVFFTETIAWTSDPVLAGSSWLYTDSKPVVRDAMCACRPERGCTWTFHSEEALFADGPLTWAPQCR